MRTVSVTQQTYPVVVSRSGARTVLALPPGHPLQSGRSSAELRLGRTPLRARVVSGTGPEAELRLGTGVPWPKALRVKLWIRPRGAGYHVGPIVAILASTYRRVRYGPQDTLFRRMVEEAEEMGGLAYVLSPGGYRAGMRAVTGYRHKGRAWRAGRYPVPDVLYNRTQASPATVAVERALARRFRVRIFNARIGSKWRQYRILLGDPLLREYLPATRLLRGSDDLRRILVRFGGAYVKPSRGGFGRGVWRVEHTRRGYDVRRTDGRGRAHRLGRASLLQAYRTIRRRRRTYIVQQRLHLLRWRGGIADVRVLMQKNIHGEWCMTGAGVRVGKGSTIVSNLSGGGGAASLNEVLSESFAHDPQLAAGIERAVPEIAERVARRLERVARPIGELGIDLGIDQHGRIWFLEANSRTGRSLFHLLDKETAGRLADRRPMEFALYLAGFRVEQPDSYHHRL